MEDQLLYLEKVLLLIRQNELYAKLSKCSFGIAKVEYLGYLISGNGVETDPKKIKAIANWPETSITEGCNEFLGLIGY